MSFFGHLESCIICQVIRKQFLITSVSCLLTDLLPHEASWIQPELSEKEEMLSSSSQASGPHERSRSVPGQGVKGRDQSHYRCADGHPQKIHGRLHETPHPRLTL